MNFSSLLFYIINFRVMTTKVKSSSTSRKSSAKGAKVSAKDLQVVVNSVSAVAPVGVGVTAGGSAAGSVLPAVGAAAPDRKSVV